jgi:hypothetical protein
MNSITYLADALAASLEGIAAATRALARPSRDVQTTLGSLAKNGSCVCRVLLNSTLHLDLFPLRLLTL